MTDANLPIPSNWIDRIELAIAIILQVAIAFITFGALRGQQWLVAFSGIAILVLSFAPAIIERQLRVRLPVEFTLVTCVFLYACFALGDVSDFYDRIWWWDLMLHGFSAFIMGLIGFLAIYVFYMTHRVSVAPIYVSIITFAMANSVGVLWEIFEFVADWFFATNLQQSGLVDTMTDLMINAIGALVAAAIGYYYVLNGDSLLGQKVIRNLVDRNYERIRRRQSNWKMWHKS
jgi:hypothetical protein